MKTNSRSVCAVLVSALAAFAFACGGTEDTADTVAAPANNDGAGNNSMPVEVVRDSLEIVLDPELSRYNTSELTVNAVMSDGSRQLVEEGIEWSSSDESIASIDANGGALGVKMGAVTITATQDGMTATLETSVGCAYPNFPNDLRFNNVMPAIGWNDAHNPDGSSFRFSMEDFYCKEEFDKYTSIILMVKAAWCGPCSNYAQNRLNPAASELEEAGALIVYMECQDLDFGLADSAYAYRHMRNLIDDGPGLRVGDKSTMATVPADLDLPGYIQGTDLIQAFPTLIVIRRSDMKVIAESARAGLSLPLEEIINNLDADWSDPSAMFTNNCQEGDEEDSEPNNTLAEAAVVGAGEYEGGICTPDPDNYEIDIQGLWKATVEFDGNVGDLDLVVFPSGSDQGDVSSQGSGNIEEVEFTGGGILSIIGYGGASAPYTLTVEAL
jgi:hypothetical protein